jgi:hypothetical protein
MAGVAQRAGKLGMTPERYVKYLVEEDLAISPEAKTTTFDELMGLGRKVDEREIDRLVEAAKTKYHQRVARKG